MAQFDLEAARRGDPIECLEAYGWTEIKFIGTWADDVVVCQVPWNDKPEIVPVSKIRMAEKKEVIRYRVALMNHGRNFTLSANSESGVASIEDQCSFVRWLTDWQEYEIGANDE